MRDDPWDRENGPFDDMFRMVERLVEEMAENMDRMMGPHGRVNVDLDRQVAPGWGRAATDTRVDVLENEDEIRVVADLPGVSREDIDLRCDGQVLSITAGGEHREYRERIRLPGRVDEETGGAKYNNGILEVRFTRADRSDAGTSIQIE